MNAANTWPSADVLMISGQRLIPQSNGPCFDNPIAELVRTFCCGLVFSRCDLAELTHDAAPEWPTQGKTEQRRLWLLCPEFLAAQRFRIRQF